MIQKITERASEELHQCGGVLAAHFAKTSCDPNELQHFANAFAFRIGRRFKKERLQVGGEVLQLVFDLEKAFNVMRCDALQFFSHPLFV